MPLQDIKYLVEHVAIANEVVKRTNARSLRHPGMAVRSDLVWLLFPQKEEACLNNDMSIQSRIG